MDKIRHTPRVVLVVENQPTAHTGPAAPDFPKKERIRHKVVIQMDLIRIRPIEMSHEGLAQLVTDMTVADDGPQIFPVAGQPGEWELYSVILFVQPDLDEGVDIVDDYPAFVLEAVKLVVGDINRWGDFMRALRI